MGFAGWEFLVRRGDQLEWGCESETVQRDSRIGATASFPISKHQSLKISYNDGAYINYGGNYQNVSLAWQYSWIGWPK